MTRSRNLQIAAVLLVALALLDIIPAIRTLSYGSAGAPPFVGADEGNGPPFWAGIMFVVLAVATLFGAYGLWNGQKWGKIVTLATRALLLLFALGDLVGATAAGAFGFAALSGSYVVISLIVVYLVLRRQPNPALA